MEDLCKEKVTVKSPKGAAFGIYTARKVDRTVSTFTWLSLNLSRRPFIVAAVVQGVACLTVWWCGAARRSKWA